MIRLSIEERLTIFAEGGRLNGFTLRIWADQAPKIQKPGIVHTDPIPTGR